MTQPTSAAILGAGTMGHGIALVCAKAGLQVALYDVSQDFVSAGLEKARAFLQKGVEKKKTAPEERDRIVSLLRGTTSLEDAVKDAQLVIEAAPEKMALKREI